VDERATATSALNLKRKWDRNFRYPTAEEKRAVETSRHRTADAIYRGPTSGQRRMPPRPVGLLAGGACVARGLCPERRIATPCRVARGPRCQKRASAHRPILRQGRHEWQMSSVCSSKSGNS
jgi:hypothetical protein